MVATTSTPHAADPLSSLADAASSLRAADAHPSTAAVAGHPIHPALVPVPIGMLTGVALSDVAYLLTRDAFFARASRWLLRGGLLSGGFAALFGATDFATVRAARSSTGIAHAGGNLTIMALGAASLALRRGDRRRVPVVALALSGIATFLLGITGWLGGELSYRERVGVIPRDHEGPSTRLD